jgi:16S rRNA (guanine1207-N2)-methyltransferase
MPSPILDLLAVARPRLRPPVAVVLGAPRLAADLVAVLGLPETTCYQMDLYQADRLRGELSGVGAEAEVTTAADLWDLPAHFNTALYPSPPRGDRELKRDMVEQAYHVLRPHGALVVLSPVPKDRFFPAVQKKIFGKVALESGRSGTVLWSPRGEDRPRRRHEISFQVRDPRRRKASDPGLLTFQSRPGVFTYGRMDEGARALIEAADVRSGEHVLDLGCGTGAVGRVGRPAGRAGRLGDVRGQQRAGGGAGRSERSGQRLGRLPRGGDGGAGGAAGERF